MTLFSIFERETEPPAAVADRFSWFAAILPPVYMLAHGLWLAAIGFVVALAVIVGAGLWLGGDTAFWLYVLLALFIGFESPALRRAKLRRRRFAYRTELFAPSEDMAEVDWLRRRGAS